MKVLTFATVVLAAVSASTGTGMQQTRQPIESRQPMGSNMVKARFLDSDNARAMKAFARSSSPTKPAAIAAPLIVASSISSVFTKPTTKANPARPFL